MQPGAPGHTPGGRNSASTARVACTHAVIQYAACTQAIPLDVVYEDAHLLVVNKQAGLVVHPSPGHAAGTLVNALLHHCRLPAMRVVPRSGGGLEPAVLADEARAGSGPGQAAQQGWAAAAGACGGLEALPEGFDLGLELDEEPEDDEGVALSPALEPLQGAGVREGYPGSLNIIRPGIVHRLDKGTTGLLVVAKTDAAHARLAEQFKAHTVRLLLPVPHAGLLLAMRKATQVREPASGSGQHGRRSFAPSGQLKALSARP